jgi:hypothetical protein
MSIRLILVIAAQNNLDIKQLDAKTAFFVPSLEEDIFIAIPEEMNILPSFKEKHKLFEAKHSKSIIALKLQKSLYGLKQDPRNWYKLLTSH